MSQTSIIAGALAVAFAIFLVYEGDFPCYLAVLGLSNTSNCKMVVPITSSTGAATGAIQLTPGSGGGVTVLPPTIGSGPVVIQPPVIHL